MSVIISGIGHYVPAARLTNQELEARIDTTDEWIRAHTGIVERRCAASGGSSELAVRAISACLESARATMRDVDCLIVATSTPDYAFPSTAAVTLRKLGATRTWGFDVSAACSGFLYALAVAASLIRAGSCRRVVVAGAERLTAITDYTDRLTAVLFGDAAAAVVLEASTTTDTGLVDIECRLQPVQEELLFQPGGGTANPATAETVAGRKHYLHLDGRKVFQAAVESMASVSSAVLARNSIRSDAIDWFVPHQANLRIIREVSCRLDVPMQRVMVNLDRYGNTSAASIPLCLSESYRRGELEPGAKVLLASFGAGFTSASAFLLWSMPRPT